VHIDVKHVPKLRTTNGESRKRFLFVAIDRCSLEFPRFDGHSSGLMRRCLNVAIPSSISAGVSSADGGTGPRWP
jgi:hypothetical protein